jgi:hypothetical protein
MGAVNRNSLLSQHLLTKEWVGSVNNVLLFLRKVQYGPINANVM